MKKIICFFTINLPLQLSPRCSFYTPSSLSYSIKMRTEAIHTFPYEKNTFILYVYILFNPFSAYKKIALSRKSRAVPWISNRKSAPFSQGQSSLFNFCLKFVFFELEPFSIQGPSYFQHDGCAERELVIIVPFSDRSVEVRPGKRRDENSRNCAPNTLSANTMKFNCRRCEGVCKTHLAHVVESGFG